MEHINQAQWESLIAEDQNAVILDVRTAEEQAQGIIPNAFCIDIYKTDEFISALEQLDKTKNYYVYCKAGGRSQQACQIMDQMGFNKTYNLLGGMSLWTGKTI